MTARHIILTTNFSAWSRYSGGGQRSTHALACALAERGHRVSVVYTKPPWERVPLPTGLPYAVHWAVFHGVRTQRAAPLRVLNAVSVAHTVRAIARRDPPWVVHAQGEEGALVPSVVSCPFVLTPRYPSYPEALQRLASSRLAQAWQWLRYGKYRALGVAARRADLVCPTSEASAQVVRRVFGLDAARMAVVPNGVDPTFLGVTREADAASGPLVFFGRLEHSKGVDVLLAALARSTHRQRTLSIVGEGDTALLRRSIEAHHLTERVTVCGWESAAQLAQRLAAAAVAVLPSREESFGNAMVEAMAAATPLLTTSAGSLAEVVVADETALVVLPGDADALTAALDRLLSDPALAARLGQAGREHVRKCYAWSAVAARYEQLYEQAHAARARHAAPRVVDA